MSGIRPFRACPGEHELILNFPLGPTQSFDPGDPVYLSSQQVTEAPQDASEVLVAEFLGFAAESAIGAIDQAGATSGTENRMVGVIIPTFGQTFVTANFWSTGAAGTRVRPLGSDIGLLRTLTCENATSNWGVDDTASTGLTTDATAFIVAVYDDKGGTTLGGTLGPGDAIDADDTTNGVWVEFMMISDHQMRALAGA